MELFERNACDLSEMIKNKEISSAELTKSVFDRIKAVEGKVDAYLTLDEENAMKKAAEIDEKLAKGEELSPLAGIPVGIKDNISTKGLRTTCASKMLGNYVPPFNATVMNKLDDIVVTGKHSCRDHENCIHHASEILVKGRYVKRNKQEGYEPAICCSLQNTMPALFIENHHSRYK